uniref:Bm1011, isoform a n=1 Tax=Brugia malayi TaxID=6279 RepID=A0A0J9Y509_BRUMA|nr:Bm1011, isoform a [Brugia malayi]
MLPFLLTFLLDILFINDIHAQEWQCYDVLKQCISGNSNLLDINMINSSNINHFCETYTQLIIPCLAKRMNEKPGVTYRERYLVFRKCVENDLSRQNDSGIMMNTVKILRLYLYSCIYNSMADMSQSNCFIKLVQNCVEKIPTTRKCYYWPCKSQDFLTLKRSNLILPKEDEEDKDDEDYNEATLKFNDKRCYDRLAECAQTANILLDVKRINSRIIDEFCFNYTHAIIPCLANKVVKREDFNFFSKSLIHILQHCNSKYNMNYSNTACFV